MQSLDKVFYHSLRGCYLAAAWEFKANIWCIKNHSQLVSKPLFYYSSLDCRKYFPLQLQILNEYRNEKRFENPKTLKTHIVTKIANHGTCHGQCLAIIEQLLQAPLRDPEIILSRIQNARIMYFQTLEHIRANSERLQPSCLNLFPLCVSREDVEYLKFIDLRDRLTAQQNTVFLIRFADRKHRISHSMLYVIQEGSFWFYDARLVGLYKYKTTQDLFKSFSDHIKAFFPNSHHEKTDLLLETYVLPR